MGIDDDVIASLVAAGAPDEIIKSAREKIQRDADDFLVWPENMETVGLFLSLETQWTMSNGFSGCFPVGLSYPALETAMRMMEIPDKPEMFKRIRVMELAALEVFDKKLKEAKNGR